MTESVGYCPTCKCDTWSDPSDDGNYACEWCGTRHTTSKGTRKVEPAAVQGERVDVGAEEATKYATTVDVEDVPGFEVKPCSD